MSRHSKSRCHLTYPVLVALLVVLFQGVAIQNSSGQFISSGGPGAATGGDAVFAFGDTALIKANGYLFRTFDGGSTWTQLTNGLGAFPYRIQPNCFGRIGNTIYMATQTANDMYRSTDFGDSWTRYQDGVTWGGIATNSVSSNGRIFMAGNGFLNLSYTTGDAAGWHATTVGGIATALSLIGKDSLWATLGGKTFYSHDNGDTWTQIGDEPLTGFGLGATDYVRAGTRILAITNGGGANTTYYSEDYGASWKLATTGFANGRKFVKVSDDEIYAVGYHSLSPSVTVISAVYKTTDRGENWTPVAKMANALTMTGWRDNKLLVSGDGTFSVTPGDTNATLIPFPHATVIGLESDATDLYAVTAMGLYVRPLAGGSWSLRSTLRDYYHGAINSFTRQNGKLYLGTDLGAFVSNDNGATFTLLNATFDGSNISGLYDDGSVLFAAHLKKGVVYIYDATDTIFSSTNGGQSWNGTAVSFTSTPGFQTRGFMKHDGKYYAYGTTGFAVSADNGLSWTYTNTTEFAYTVASRLYSFAGVLYRDRYDNGGSGTFHIDYSNDGGTNWTPDSAGLTLGVLNHPNVNGVFMSDGKLYAYVTDLGKEGIATKSTLTDSWQMMNGTSQLPAFPTALVAHGSDLFIAANAESVWTNQTTTGAVSSEVEPSKARLRVYPSPAQTAFNVRLPEGVSTGRVELVDAMGRVIRAAFIRSGDPISLAGIPSGTYFVRVGTNTTKLVVE